MITAFTHMLFILTLFFEAGGECTKGQEYVADVITNRSIAICQESKEYGACLEEAMLKQYQFSCWNERRPSAKEYVNIYMDNPDLVDRLSWMATQHEAHLIKVLDSVESADSGGFSLATHYHTKSIQPGWSIADTMIPVAVEGNHIFYKDVQTLKKMGVIK